MVLIFFLCRKEFTKDVIGDTEYKVLAMEELKSESWNKVESQYLSKDGQEELNNLGYRKSDLQK